jgi:hypothetical protein
MSLHCSVIPKYSASTNSSLNGVYNTNFLFSLLSATIMLKPKTCSGVGSTTIGETALLPKHEI